MINIANNHRNITTRSTSTTCGYRARTSSARGESRRYQAAAALDAERSGIGGVIQVRQYFDRGLGLIDRAPPHQRCGSRWRSARSRSPWRGCRAWVVFLRPPAWNTDAGLDLQAVTRPS
ncbi:MAG: hypothetical protein U0531_17445 [Dehalococcoidia bacterium]